MLFSHGTEPCVSRAAIIMAVGSGPISFEETAPLFLRAPRCGSANILAKERYSAQDAFVRDDNCLDSL